MSTTHFRCPHELLASDVIHSKTPMLATLDFRVLKYFPFGETAKLDVVAEAFNLLNRANVAQINPVFGPGPAALLEKLTDWRSVGKSANARRLPSRQSQCTLTV